MLKTVSSIANAIGALNYKGTWDANANSPVLTSSVGTKGDYYVVGTAGSTTLDGISNWGIGDWAVFNGSVWQRVEGGADLNGVNLSVTGTSTLSGLTASTALALNASKQIVSVTNTGTGNNVLATAPTLVGDVSLSTGNLVQGTAAKGVNFTANTGAAGKTSNLLNWYEEGTWTPGMTASSSGTITLNGSFTSAKYTRIGRQVTCTAILYVGSVSSPTGNLFITGLPFTVAAPSSAGAIWCAGLTASANNSIMVRIDNSSTQAMVQGFASGNTIAAASWVQAGTEMNVMLTYFV